MARPEGRITAVDRPTVAGWCQPWLVVAALAGALLLTVSWYWANGGNVPDIEADVFRWLNDSLPDGLEWLIWGPMQFGAIGAVAAVAAAQLVLTRRWLPTVMTVVVGLEGWALAKVIKPIVDRGRPGVEIEDVIHRGGSVGGGIDAGRGFVSGHAAIAAALAVALTVILPARWRWAPWLLTLLVGIGRNYFGAHLPLDIVGGYGLGLLLAGATLAATGRLAGRRNGGEPVSERPRPGLRDSEGPGARARPPTWTL